jgi:hypothetical protein
MRMQQNRASQEFRHNSEYKSMTVMNNERTQKIQFDKVSNLVQIEHH